MLQPGNKSKQTHISSSKCGTLLLICNQVYLYWFSCYCSKALHLQNHPRNKTKEKDKKESKETSKLKPCPGADPDLHCSKGQGENLFGNRLRCTRIACQLQAASLWKEEIFRVVLGLEPTWLVGIRVDKDQVIRPWSFFWITKDVCSMAHRKLMRSIMNEKLMNIK